MPTPAIYLHGEQIVYFLIAVALVGLAVLSLISFFIVRFFRKRVGAKAYLLAPLPFVLAALGLWQWSRAEAFHHGPPEAVSASEATKLMRSLGGFSYAGMAHFKQRLFVSTSIGLLEMEGNKLLRLYRVQEKYSVISGPWLDPANGLLWIQDHQTDEMLNYDGQTWQRVPMPQIPKGYSPGLGILSGIRPSAGSHDFLMAAAGAVWKWNNTTQKWEEVTPPAPFSGQYNRANVIIGVLPLTDASLVIARNQSLPFLAKQGESFESDTVQLAAGNRTPIPQPKESYFAESWSSAGSAAYICTEAGGMLHVTRSLVTRLEAPGRCEAIATDGTNQLIVSIRGSGIYAYSGKKWDFRAPHPYPSGEGEYWTYLSADGKQLALAVHGKPIVDRSATTKATPGDIKFTTNAPNQLWVLEGGEFRPVKFD